MGDGGGSGDDLEEALLMHRPPTAAAAIPPPLIQPETDISATWLERTVGLKLSNFVREEIGLIGGVATMITFQIFGKRWLDVEEHVIPKAIGLFVWLFTVILILAFGVVRHADCLAIRLGEVRCWSGHQTHPIFCRGLLQLMLG